MHKVTKNPQFVLGSFSLYYVFLLYLSFISRIFGGDPGLQKKKKKKKTRHGNHQRTFARPVFSVPDIGRLTIDRLESSLDTRKHKIQEAAGEVEIASA